MRRFLTILVLFFGLSNGAMAQPAPLFGETAVRVRIEAPAEVDALSRAGYVVDNVAGGMATVYTSEAGLAQLAAAGYAFEAVARPQSKDSAYPSYADVTTALANHAAAYPGLCRVESLGTSVQGRELWAILITANPGAEEEEPAFKYVSTMHGDEPVGTYLCMRLIDRLLSGYGTDPRMTALVDSTAIWIVPLMNPDGYEATPRTRGNAHGVDLNRDFPRFPAEYTETFYDGEPLRAEGRQPETAAVMAWTANHRFVLSANLHTGALLVNYPYDDDGQPSGVDSPTPDDELFRHVSLAYSVHNPPMWNSPFFENGISNGAAWFVIDGGMQDWNYRYVGCNEVTLELSTVKTPAGANLPTFWANNEESMLSYIEQVHRGVRGTVRDSRTGEPLDAALAVAGNAQRVFTNPRTGYYHRMLLEGRYTLTASAPNYEPASESDLDVPDGPAVRLDFTLIPTAPDINADGAVDAVDLQLVINAALGLPVPHPTDIDGDGSVNAVDIQRMVNAVLQQ